MRPAPASSWVAGRRPPSAVDKLDDDEGRPSVERIPSLSGGRIWENRNEIASRRAPNRLSSCATIMWPVL